MKEPTFWETVLERMAKISPPEEINTRYFEMPIKPFIHAKFEKKEFYGHQYWALIEIYEIPEPT